MTPVLIVDDERMTRVGLRKVIEDSNTDLYVAGEAEDGQAALEVARRLQPAIILCDVRMPRTNGVEFAELLRKESADTAVIFISGYSDKEYLQSAIRLSAVDYLEKPLDPQRVLKVLLQAADEVRRSRASRDAILEQLARRLIDGRSSPPVDIDSLAVEAGFPRGDDVCYCVVAVMHRGWWRGKTATDGCSVPADTDLSRQLENSGMRTAAVSTADTWFLLLAADRGAAHGDDVAARLASRSDGHVHFGISSRVFALGDIASAAAIAVAACRALYFSSSDDNCVRIAGPDAVSEGADLTDLLRERGEQIRRTLDRLDLDEALTSILDVATTLRRVRPDQAPFVSAWFARLETMVSDAAADHGLSESTSTDDRPIAGLDFEEAVSRVLSQVRAAAEEVKDGAAAPHHVVRARKFVRDHIEEPFGLNDVAEFCGVSPAHLSRVFTAACRESFGRYVTAERIARAKRLLLQTPLQVAEVARSVGYPDQDYFSKVFRKLESISPSEFRNSRGRPVGTEA